MRSSRPSPSADRLPDASESGALCNRAPPPPPAPRSRGPLGCNLRARRQQRRHVLRDPRHFLTGLQRDHRSRRPALRPGLLPALDRQPHIAIVSGRQPQVTLKRLIGSLAVPSPPVSGQLPEERDQIVELGRLVRRDPRACFEAGHPQAYFDRPEPHVRTEDGVRGRGRHSGSAGPPGRARHMLLPRTPCWPSRVPGRETAEC